MADPVNFQVDGLRELGLRMQGLKADMAGKIARQAVAAGAGVVRAAARKGAPVDTGNLKAAVIMKRMRKPENGLTEQYIVTPRKGKASDVIAAKRGTGKLGKDAYYAHMVEFGTVKMPAQPFMRPALEQNTQRATDAMVKRLRKRLDKVGA